MVRSGSIRILAVLLVALVVCVGLQAPALAQAQARTSLYLSSASGMPRETITFEATLAYADGSGYVPGKQVYFYVKDASLISNGYFIGIGSLTDGAGVSRLNFPIPLNWSPGAREIEAFFSQDGDITGSLSYATLTVEQPITRRIADGYVYEASGSPGDTVTLQAYFYYPGQDEVVSNKPVFWLVDNVNIGYGSTPFGDGISRYQFTIPPTMSFGSHRITAVLQGDNTVVGLVRFNTLTVVPR